MYEGTTKEMYDWEIYVRYFAQQVAALNYWS